MVMATVIGYGTALIERPDRVAGVTAIMSMRPRFVPANPTRSTGFPSGVWVRARARRDGFYLAEHWLHQPDVALPVDDLVVTAASRPRGAARSGSRHVFCWPGQRFGGTDRPWVLSTHITMLSQQTHRHAFAN
jgi:hypothetical protein